MPLIPAHRRQKQAHLSDLGQPGLQNLFQDKSRLYTKKPCLEQPPSPNKTKRNTVSATRQTLQNTKQNWYFVGLGFCWF